jgi:hypothetical protein
MNIKNLEIGKVYKSYRQVCQVLGEPIKDGNSKRAQMKMWERCFLYERTGNKIIIKELYSNPITKVENRGGGNNVLKHPLTHTNPLLASEWSTEENGMEIPETLTRRTNQECWWKCSKCSHLILSTPIKRLNALKGVSDECIICPYCNMSKGAKRIYKFLIKYKMFFRTEYTFDDLKGLGGNKLRFDFAVFNNDKLISLIEFDGGFHDEDLNPNPEKYKILSTHDKLKDDYCNDNNLPLLRIHHTQTEESFVHLVRHFQTIDITQDQKNKINEDYDNLIAYENERACLLLKLKQLDKQITNIK